MKSRPWLIKIIALTTLILIAAFFITTYVIWNNNYRERIYPGIKIGNYDFSGKTLSEATNYLSEQTKKIEDSGLKFQYNGKSSSLNTSIVSFDSDLSLSAISFDLDKTILAIYGNGTDKTFINYLLNFFHPNNKNSVRVIYTLNEDVVKSFLTDTFPELNIKPENAYFSLASGDVNNLKLNRNPEKPGKEINYTQAILDVRANLDNLKDETITIKTHSQYPTVRQNDLDNLEPEVLALVNRGNLILRQPTLDGATTTETWQIKPSRLISWASVQDNNGRLQLSLDQEKIKDYLKNNIAPNIDLASVLPRFEIKGGRVTSWQTGQSGRALDLIASASEITKSFLDGRNEALLITRELTEEAINIDNNLDIKEIIGTGHSIFTGSPANRRRNIAVGAAALHGLLIKPGEEFSLIKTLGDVSDKTGYLPELVIKGNKTVPEFGGGLCQIGTTVFRTALASGLPITMRQNHSYRVSYYEPAGTDATIYIPQPDLRFVNDTGNYVLIQARIIKNDLYFDFWGTKDGRIATTTYPVIYNIVKPEPTKIIESTDLKPGEKKCTESSHNGADAYFDYKVIYPEGSTTTPIQERRFKSHYTPWQAVCLVGKSISATSTPDLNIISTSTPNNSSQNKKATGTPTASSSLSN